MLLPVIPSLLPEWARLLEIIGYCAFDLSLFLAAITFVLKIGRPEKIRSETVTTVLAVKLLCGAAIPLAFSFLGIFQREAYFALTIALAAGSFYYLKPLFASPLLRSELLSMPVLRTWASVLLFVAVLMAFSPILISAMRPVFEDDSVAAIGDLLGWINQGGTPYDFKYNYVSLVEAGYLPVIILARQDTLFWFVSLQSVLLFGFATYRLSRLLEISRRLALTAALSALTLYWFWAGVSGVQTIKNDMLYNAGILLLVSAVLAVWEGGGSAITTIIFTCGVVFATTKYSGPILLLGLLPASGCLFFFARRPKFQAFLKMILVALPIAIVTTGHFYLRNLFAHGNPFYPWKLTVLGFSLPGTIDFQGTSILSNWRTADVWQALLFTTKEGLLFPIALVAIILYFPLLFSPLFKPREVSGTRLVAGIALLAWLVFFASQWSAGTLPGKFDYILAHVSFRYASAADVMTKVAVAAFLVRLIPRSELTIGFLLILDGAYKLNLLYSQIHQSRWELIWPVIFTALIALAALGAVMMLLRPRFRIALALLLPGGFLLVSPAVGEMNRKRWWLNDFLPSLEAIREAPSKRMAVLESPGLWPLVYPASGQYFQHKVKKYREDELSSLAKSGCQSLPDAVTLYAVPEMPAGLIDRLTPQLVPCGLSLVAKNSLSGVYMRQATIQLDKGRASKIVTSFFDGSNETEVARHFSKSSDEFVLSGFGAKAQLWARTPAGPAIALVPVGTQVRVSNLGGQVNTGGYSGLTITEGSAGWSVGREQIDKLYGQFGVSTLNEGSRVNPQWVVAGGGTFKTTFGQDSGTEILSVTADAAMDWLAAIFKGTTGARDESVALIGEIRVRGGADVSANAMMGTTMVRLLPLPGDNKWTRFVLQQEFKAGSVYSLAVGLGKVQPGAALDIRSVRVLRVNLPTGVDGIYADNPHN
jgi:hypothetical protein